MFSSIEECQNATEKCFGHGSCIKKTNNNGGEYGCDCASKFNPALNCSQNFFEVWNGRDNFYFVVGYIAFSIAFLLMLFEAFTDVRRGKVKGFLFGAKIVSLVFCALRIANYILWQLYTSYGSQGIAALSWLDSLLFNFGGTAGLSVFVIVLILWIDLVSRTKNLVDELSEKLKTMRFALVVALILYFPISGIFSLLNALGIAASTMNTLYNVHNGLYLVVISCISFYYVARMNNLLKGIQEKSNGDKKFTIVIRKNSLLVAVDVVCIFYVITLVLYIIIGAKNDPWKYLVTMFILRIEEIILVFLFVFFLEAALLAGPAKVKNAWTTAGTTQQSRQLQVSTQQQQSRQLTARQQSQQQLPTLSQQQSQQQLTARQQSQQQLPTLSQQQSQQQLTARQQSQQQLPGISVQQNLRQSPQQSPQISRQQLPTQALPTSHSDGP